MKLIKKLATSIALISMPLCSYAAANDGVCNYNNQKISYITCSGTAQIVESIVIGKTSVAGPLQATESKLNSVEVAGVINLTNTLVKGTLSVAGPLFASGSNLSGQVFVAADKVNLAATKVNGPITIKSNVAQPYLDLTCGSVIQQSVIFEGRPGIVRKSADSQVLGKIVNGTLMAVDSAAKCS